MTAKTHFSLRQKYEIGGIVQTQRAKKYSEIFDAIETLFNDENKELILTEKFKITLKDIRQMYVDACHVAKPNLKFLYPTFYKCIRPEPFGGITPDPIFANDFMEALKGGWVKNYTEYRNQLILNAPKSGLLEGRRKLC